MRSEKSKGNGFAILSGVFQASVLVFWTYLLGIFSRPVLMIWWFGVATILLVLYLLITGKLKFDISGRFAFPLILFGFLSALSTFLLMTSARIVGASITAFVMQTTVIFALFYSVVGLKEKFKAKEFVGIAFVVFGLFVLNWKVDLAVSMSSLIVMFAAFVSSTNHFMAKKLLFKIPKLQLNLVRVFCIFLFGLIYLLITQDTFQMITFNVLLIVILGVLLGPIFVYVFYYSALQKINLGTANALKGIGPVFTFALSFLFLGEVLTLQQSIAAVILVFGAYLIIKKDK